MWLAAACPKQCFHKFCAAGRMHTPHASTSQVRALGGAACAARRNASQSATYMHCREAQTPCVRFLCQCNTCAMQSCLTALVQLMSWMHARRLTGPAKGCTYAAHI